VYFESIHPFEDGNGRVGRALVEKALAQGLGGPIITAISPTIMLRRGEYYRQLEAASKTMEITTWLAWFAGAAVEAQERAIANVEFVVHKAKLLERVRGRLNARQDAVLSRMLREGPAGFKGGMSASKYVVIAKTSSASATRDLGELVDMGALVRTGERKGTRYQLAMPMRHVGRVVVDENGEIRDEAHEEL
jgi:Fic family protein